MENLENENIRKPLRTYEDFKEDNYQYRVDEILENIESSHNEYIETDKESNKLYNELKEMLEEKGQKVLLHYADAEIDKKSYELYALARQVYKDLKER